RSGRRAPDGSGDRLSGRVKVLGDLSASLALNRNGIGDQVAQERAVRHKDSVRFFEINIKDSYAHVTPPRSPFANSSASLAFSHITRSCPSQSGSQRSTIALNAATSFLIF